MEADGQVLALPVTGCRKVSYQSAFFTPHNGRMPDA